jgi:GntR family transcriptional regulator
MNSIERNSVLPLYYQLAGVLREQIRSGQLEPGAGLPSERELMADYHLSRNTVRQAMDLLEREGLIIRTHGLGTSVSQLSNRFEYKLDTFYENWDLLVKAGYTPSVEFLSTEKIAPPEQVRQALKLEPGQKTVCHTMVFRADGHPAMFTQDYLPGEFDQKYDLSTSGEGFLCFLDRTAGERVDYVLTEIEPVEATGTIARTFGCPPGTPVLLYHEIFLDATQSKPIAYSMNYFNRDLVKFRLLTRRG